MQKTYLIAGKRLQAGSSDDKDINHALRRYNLVKNDDGSTFIRRTSDPEGTVRYNEFHSYGDYVDFLGQYDFCVGLIVENRSADKKVVEADVSDLEKALAEVRADIPDAKIIALSHWI